MITAASCPVQNGLIGFVSAASLNLSDGASVTAWTDQISGATMTTQGVPGVNPPIFHATRFRGGPCVTSDASSGLGGTRPQLPNGTTGTTTFQLGGNLQFPAMTGNWLLNPEPSNPAVQNSPPTANGSQFMGSVVRDDAGQNITPLRTFWPVATDKTSLPDFDAGDGPRVYTVVRNQNNIVLYDNNHAYAQTIATAPNSPITHGSIGCLAWSRASSAWIKIADPLPSYDLAATFQYNRVLSKAEMLIVTRWLLEDAELAIPPLVTATSRVYGYICALDGTPIEGAKITFKITELSTVDDTPLISRDEVTAVTDSNGLFVQRMAVGAVFKWCGPSGRFSGSQSVGNSDIQLQTQLI